MPNPRPKPARDIIVSFRLTRYEAAHLDAAGAALNRPRSRSDFARAAALYAARQKVPEPSRPIRNPPRRKAPADIKVMARVLGQLGQLGSNVNQLARHANQRGPLPTLRTLEAIAHEVQAIRQAVAGAIGG